MKPIKSIEISSTVAHRKAIEGILLVDVREKDEVNQLAFDVPNISNIPLTEFENRYKELPKDKELIIVCRGGIRSLRAALFLMANGFTKILNMQNGIMGWSKDGFPVRKSTQLSQHVDETKRCCKATAENNSSCCNSKTKDKNSCCRTR